MPGERFRELPGRGAFDFNSAMQRLRGASGNSFYEEFKRVDANALKKFIPFMTSELHENASRELLDTLSRIIKLNKKLGLTSLPEDPKRVTLFDLTRLTLWLVQNHEEIIEKADSRRAVLEEKSLEHVQTLFGSHYPENLEVKNITPVLKNEEKIRQQLAALKAKLEGKGLAESRVESQQAAVLKDFFAHGAAQFAVEQLEREAAGGEKGVGKAKELVGELKNAHSTRTLAEEEALAMLLTEVSHYAGVIFLNGTPNAEIPALGMGAVPRLRVSAGETKAKTGGERKALEGRKALPATIPTVRGEERIQKGAESAKETSGVSGETEYAGVHYSTIHSLVHEAGELAGRRMVEGVIPMEVKPETPLHECYSMVYGKPYFKSIAKDVIPKNVLKGEEEGRAKLGKPKRELGE
ncbi:hypothetical protein H0N96_03345 [Candidatus Micrarchaeota archaeon]|nr:hypothetical protein [Candidatus Micrarchaeota archaeon]